MTNPDDIDNGGGFGCLLIVAGLVLLALTAGVAVMVFYRRYV